MKKTTYLLIVLSLIIIAFLLYKKNNSGKKMSFSSDVFAVKDTKSVTKIFMVDKANNRLLLEKKNGEWLVNNKFISRPSAIKTLLETISAVRIKYPVGKNKRKTIIKKLSASHVKISIFNDDEKIISYFVGGADASMTGTYMYLEDTKDPFVVHIPNFRGYLTPRYFTSEKDWKEKVIFKYSANEIKIVKVEYPLNKKESFEIVKKLLEMLIKAN